MISLCCFLFKKEEFVYWMRIYMQRGRINPADVKLTPAHVYLSYFYHRQVWMPTQSIHEDIISSVHIIKILLSSFLFFPDFPLDYPKLFYILYIYCFFLTEADVAWKSIQFPTKWCLICKLHPKSKGALMCVTVIA